MPEQLLDKVIEQSTQDMEQCLWVRDEFNDLRFGDWRLYLRFLVVAEHLARQPQVPVNQACDNWAKTKATYRFFDNKKVTEREILLAHVNQTVKRISYQTERVIVIQDTSFLNFNHMSCSKDLGPIGKTNLKNPSMGLIMHTSLAVTSRMLPLGILDQSIWARERETCENKAECDNLPIEEKESFKWIAALRKCHKALPVSTSNIVHVADRESDIYEFFLEARNLKEKVIVRAKHNRVLGDTKLWPLLQQQEAAGTYSIEVPTNHERPKRKAELSVRFAPITIKCPKDRIRFLDEHPDLALWAVYVTEPNPPTDVEPIEWMLLANATVVSIEQAREVIETYKIRWQIEVFHRILKSGCQIEHARFEKNCRRIPYVTLKCIIAWKLQLITHYHRICPNEPAASLISPIECRALFAAIHDKLPATQCSFSAREALRWIGQLGGFLARKNDKEPGPMSVWRGWQRLQDFSRMLAISSKQKQESLPH